LRGCGVFVGGLIGEGVSKVCNLERSAFICIDGHHGWTEPPGNDNLAQLFVLFKVCQAFQLKKNKERKKSYTHTGTYT